MYWVRLVLLFILLVKVGGAYTQVRPADSAAVIQLISQSGKLGAKNKQAQDSVIQAAITLAAKINRPDYLLRFYNHWSFQRVVQNEFREAITLCQQGIAVAKNNTVLQNNVSYRDIVAHMAMCYLYVGNRDSSLYWIKTLKQQSQKHKDPFNTSIAYVFEAINNVHVLPDETVIALFDTAASIAATTTNLHDDALAIYNKGYFLQDKKQKDWPGAVTAYISLKNLIADESMDEYQVKVQERVPFWFRNVKLTLYGSLAKVYYYLANLDDACYYQELAYQEQVNKHNYNYLPYGWGTLAEMEVFRNDYKKVKHIYDSCMVLLSTYHQTTDVPIPSLYFAKGWLYEQEKNTVQAEQSYKKALAIMEGSFHPSAIALLRLYVNTGQVNKAAAVKKTVDSIIGKTGLLFFQAAYSKELAGYYEAIGDKENALKSHLQYYRYKDSLNTTARYYLVKEVETKFKTGEKEQQLAIANEKQRLQQKLLKESNQRIWILSGAIVLLTVLTIALYKIYKTKQKQSRLLVLKNQQIETLMRELHHRVKNNLQVVSSLLNLQSNRVEDDIARDALEQGKSRVDAMAMIHQKLYMDEVSASINMTDYLESLCLSLAASFGYDSRTVKVTVSLADTKMDIDKAIPVGLIVNELVTNAFKYAFNGISEPLVTVRMISANAKVTVMVSDNGTGFDSTLVMNKKESFGIKLVNMLVGQLKGEMKTEQKNGAVFTITYKP
jgi:two-component sensor histidine kinase